MRSGSYDVARAMATHSNSTINSDPEKSCKDSVREKLSRFLNCCGEHEYGTLELLFLFLIVVGMFALYMIPTYYYVNPPLDFTLNPVSFLHSFCTYWPYFVCRNILIQVTKLIPNFETQCSSRYSYTGRVCRKELSQPETCLSNSSLEISATDQETIEQYLVAWLNSALPGFNPSPECTVAFRSFFCLYLFGACDGNASAIATGATCRDVRDRACVREWRAMDDFLQPNGLPVCEDLPGGTIMDSTGAVPLLLEKCKHCGGRASRKY